MLEGGSGLAVGQRAAGRALGSLSSSAPQGGPEIAVENCEDTTVAPELRTAKRWPERPFTKPFPLVAP